jgi:hypothetical protein
MLQREVEQLRRQLEQLAQSGQQDGQANQQGGQSNGSPRDSEAGQRSSSQSAEQALNRLRQAEENMRRAAATPGTQADARLAAQRLRDAMQLLRGLQSQEAAGRLGAIVREADRLIAEEKAEADRAKQLKAGAGAGPAQAPETRKLAADRQKMADDVSALQEEIRRVARELNQNQAAASDKLRTALDGIDLSDLETRLQRTADWLRTGIDPNSNGTEAQIASSLHRLGDQLHSAQQALSTGGGDPAGNADAILNGVERLRPRTTTTCSSSKVATPS